MTILLLPSISENPNFRILIAFSLTLLQHPIFANAKTERSFTYSIVLVIEFLRESAKLNPTPPSYLASMSADRQPPPPTNENQTRKWLREKPTLRRIRGYPGNGLTNNGPGSNVVPVCSLSLYIYITNFGPHSPHGCPESDYS